MTTAPPLVLLRPDSGAAAGLGHVQRCLALAAGLREAGAVARFAVPAAAAVRPRIEGWGFAVDQLADPLDPDELASRAAALGACALVVDSYATDLAFQRRLGLAGVPVAVLDDHAATAVHAQLCINGGAHAGNLPYVSDAGGTRFLLGPRFVLLRPELWDAWPAEPGVSVGEVLVALGGSDPHGLAPQLVTALAGVGDPFALAVVRGPYFGDPAPLDAAVEAAVAGGRRVRVLDAPTTFTADMQSAGLAVSAAGQTLHELVRLGVPSIGLEVAGNQRGPLAALAAAGAVRSAGSAADPGLPERVAALAAELCHNTAARHALGATAAAFLDGQGARRVAAAILGLAHVQPSAVPGSPTP